MMSTRTLIVASAMLAAIPAARADDAKDEKGCLYADLTYAIGAIICVPRSNIALRCVPGGSPRNGGLSPSAPFWDSSVTGWPADQQGQHACLVARPDRD
jgi:hypothetical protein